MAWTATLGLNMALLDVNTVACLWRKQMSDTPPWLSFCFQLPTSLKPKGPQHQPLQHLGCLEGSQDPLGAAVGPLLHAKLLSFLLPLTFGKRISEASNPGAGKETHLSIQAVLKKKKTYYLFIIC